MKKFHANPSIIPGHLAYCDEGELLRILSTPARMSNYINCKAWDKIT